MSDSPKARVPKLDLDEFLDELRHRTSLGHGFTPLVGAGLSAASGILTASAFSDYLLHCVHSALECQSESHGADDHDNEHCERFDPRTQAWPTPPSDEQLKRARDWRARIARNLAKNADALDPGALVAQEAIGCLADWRSTLSFLSRVRVPKPAAPARDVGRDHARPKSVPPLSLAAPDISVIDAFNLNLVRGSRFNLGHQMLALLSGPLRVTTVLTTNFDTLIEDAFSTLRYPHIVFDIHTSGGLPHPRLLSKNLSIIKLHGSRFETRADYSLDATPRGDDCKRFCEYLTRGTGSDVLVLGFAGRDERVLALLGAAQQSKQGRDVRIYWVCHSNGDYNSLRERLATYPHIRARATVARADLLLFELYQRLTDMVPPAGLLYEFGQYVPPEPTRRPPDDHAQMTPTTYTPSNRKTWYALAKDLDDTLKKHDTLKEHDTLKKQSSRQFIVLDGDDGVSSIAAEYFSILAARGVHCVWLELDDFVSVTDFEATLFQAVSTKIGRTHQDALSLVSAGLEGGRAVGRAQPKDKPPRLFGDLGIDPARWAVFVYGRSAAGANAGLTRRAKFNTKDFYKSLLPLFELLSPGLRVIYMPLLKARARLIGRRLDQQRGPRGSKNRPLSTYDPDTIVRRPDAKFVGGEWQWLSHESNAHENDPARTPSKVPSSALESFQTILNGFEQAVREGNANHGLPTFTYALTLLRQSGPPVILADTHVFGGNLYKPAWDMHGAWRWDDLVHRWVRQFEALGYVRRKPGGAIWIHRDLRIAGRTFLERERRALLPQRSRLELGIAWFYHRMFLATGNITPWLECVFHYREAYDVELRSDSKARGDDRDSLRRFAERVAALTGLVQVLRHARLQLLGKLEPLQALHLLKTWRTVRAPAAPATGTKRDVLSDLSEVIETAVGELRTAFESRSDTVSHGFLRPVVKDAAHSKISETLTALIRKYDKTQRLNIKEYYEAIETRASTEARESELYKLWDAILHDLCNQVVMGKRQTIPRRFEELDWSGIYATVSVFAMQKSAGHRDLALRCLRRLAHCLYTQAHLQFAMTEMPSQKSSSCHHVISSKGMECSPSCVKRAWISMPGPLWATKAQAAWRVLSLHEALLRVESGDAEFSRELINSWLVRASTLAYLGRFKEGHRHLDEVAAWLREMPVELGTVGFAAVELRRALLYLLSADHDALTPPADHDALPAPQSAGKEEQTAEEKERSTEEAERGDGDRQFRARMYDAWRCIDRAERHLSGRTRATGWWQRLHVLRLHVLAAAASVDDSCTARMLLDLVGPDVRAYYQRVITKILLLAPPSLSHLARAYAYTAAIEARLGISDRSSDWQDDVMRAIKRHRPYASVGELARALVQHVDAFHHAARAARRRAARREEPMARARSRGRKR